MPQSPQHYFSKSFTQQEPIPEAGIERAVEILRSGRLHRYNTLPGELSEAELLEKEYAKYLGVPYCLACASGGYALHIALKAAGIKNGEPVLTNAFTLAPVPGAINNAGGTVVLVEIDENYCVDLAHLEKMMQESGSRFFMISHMRGHLADMDAIVALCEKHGVMLIEDCAHTMGASWNGKASGTFGKIACFSTQTYKHINSGEGGLLTTDDAEVMARAVMHSGSYMLYERHAAGPPKEAFETIRYETPNISGRMDNLRAAILRPQLKDLDRQVQRWNERYFVIEEGLRNTPGLTVIDRPEKESIVGSSIQFLLEEWSEAAVHEVQSSCAARGVELKWFGGAEPVGFTSRYDSWRYVDAPRMPKSDAVLAGIVDMRVPLTFSLEDCALIARIIRSEVSRVFQAAK